MLDIKDLSVSYGKRRVLHSLSVSFAEGEITAVIGENGSGKSTLLRAVCGIIPHSEGSILIDGTDASELSMRQRALRVAYLSQWHPFSDMTVFDVVLQGRFPHLTYPRRYREEDLAAADAAIERVGLTFCKEEHVAALSGGQRQLVYIAMALAADAKYVLLDEPMTYLDISHTLTLMEVLDSLKCEGRGIALVMHDIPTALAFADKIAVVADGGILRQGTPDEVLSSGILKERLSADIFRTPDGYGYKLK